MCLPWLHACEGPPGRNQRHICLSRLDYQFAVMLCGDNDRVINRAQMSAIGILLLDQFVSRGEEKVRIAETFHDQERLRVTRNPLV